MCPKRHGTRFSRAHPAVWTAITGGSSRGQLMRSDDLYAYASLRLFWVFQADVGARYWVMLSRALRAGLFAHKLDLATVAEGVETSEQLDSTSSAQTVAGWQRAISSAAQWRWRHCWRRIRDGESGRQQHEGAP